MPVTEPPPDEMTEASTLVPRSWAWCFWRHARKWVIAVIGGTLLLVGGILFLIPGPPGWPLILTGLALLATEFAWARWMLKSAQDRLQRLAGARNHGDQSDRNPRRAVAVAEPSTSASPHE